METLLYAALSNAAVAVVLVLIISLVGRFSRRPALLHSLWLVVFLKLLTPPLWPVPFSWPVHSEAAPVATELVIRGPSRRTEPVDTLARGALAEAGTGAAAEVGVISASPAVNLKDPAPPPPQSVPAAEPLPMPMHAIPLAPAAPSTTRWQFWLSTVWLCGSALWLLIAWYRLYRFQRLLRLTHRAPANLQKQAHRLAERLGLARCPGVWIVAAPISPLLWAILGQPRLLVPAALLERLTEEQWDTLLAHELAHLRRRDHWVRLLELAVIGLYWWHPVVWWARRQLREAEEQCCDAWVVWALPGAAEVYASTLVETITYLSGARSLLPLAASGIGQMHLLKRRLTMIMRGTTPRALSAAGSFAVLGLAAALLPLYPTLARTEQGPDHVGNQQPVGGAAPRTTDVPAAGAAALAPDRLHAAALADGADYSVPEGRFSSMAGPTGRNRNYAETVEDAQDDVDLLRVQLEMRKAELREEEIRLRPARSDLERKKRLATNHAVDSLVVERATDELQIQEARIAAKNAQVREGELRLKQAERRLARLRPRTAAPAKTSAPYDVRPGGSAIPPQHATGGGLSGGSGWTGGRPFGGGIIAGRGQGGSFGRGIPGGTGGYGGMPAGMSQASSYEHRLAEVEKKLQSLMEEMKTLRKEHRREKAESDQKRP